MDTKAEIIKIADALIREKGYNAFSFSDISKQLNIKNASIHYYFPTKTHLGISIINEHQKQLDALIKETSTGNALKKLNAFLSIYATASNENKICLVGSLATDLYTVEPQVQDALKKLVDNILAWVKQILKEGKQNGLFYFETDVRTKALMVITNMLASVQLTRLTGRQDFFRIKKSIINDLTNNI